MTKSKLIKSMAKRMGVTERKVLAFFHCLEKHVVDSLHEKEKVIIAGLGSVKLRLQRARICKVPRSNKILNIPTKNVPVFKINRKLKDFFKNKRIIY
ncbi:HU family DNA-binding protein [Candidatus Phytoplasma palmae]|uniref:HU family DNA-binding protein n=1 Tax=Candidatus Phytoplasma palmae TaxID=85624 RepID=UPI0039909B5C